MIINKAIFYIKYYADKHKMVIERKATLDEIQNERSYSWHERRKILFD